MSVGDLVFCHGFTGLIVETHYDTNYTEHRVYWFNTHDNQPFCWVSQKRLTRIA